jgi:hypothetical protein
MYKVGIRILKSALLEQKYIYYLIRRINLHLINHEAQTEEYNDQWGAKATFFRD